MDTQFFYWLLGVSGTVIILLFGIIKTLWNRAVDNEYNRFTDLENNLTAGLKDVIQKIDNQNITVYNHSERIAILEKDTKGLQAGIDKLREDKREVYTRFGEIDKRLNSIEKTCMVNHK